jgi:hypothetical protein
VFFERIEIAIVVQQHMPLVNAESGNRNVCRLSDRDANGA